MSTEIAVIPINDAKKQLVESKDFEKEVAKLKKEYGTLKLKGPTDKDMYETIKDAHNKVIKPIRTGIEKKRKELNEPALQYQRDLKAEADRLTDMIAPIEKHLVEQREIYEKAEAKRKEEEERARAKKIADRAAKIKALSPTTTPDGLVIGNEFITDGDIEHLTDSDFNVKFELLKEERERLDGEEAARKEAEAKLQKENEEMKRRLAELEAKDKASKEPTGSPELGALEEVGKKADEKTAAAVAKVNEGMKGDAFDDEPEPVKQTVDVVTQSADCRFYRLDIRSGYPLREGFISAVKNLVSEFAEQ